MHRVRDLSLVFYLLACMLPALTLRGQTFWGIQCLLFGWRALTIHPLLFFGWVANFVFFWAIWTGRAGHSVQTFVLAVSACLLALFVPLSGYWLRPGYYFWHGSMLLFAWKTRTAGEAVWPAA